MVSTVSPAATVIAVPPSQLQLPDEVGLRSNDPVTSGAPGRAVLFETMALPPGVPAGFAARDVLVPAGCGTCAVCACGIEAVASGWLKGFSLNRDVSALQAATLAVI